MGLGSQVAGLLTGAAIFGVILWVYEYRLFTIPMTAIWAWVAVFFLEDLTYYWFHRLSHERRFWWASHVNHHTSQHYNLATALRQTWTGGLAGTWLLWLPLILLGFPPAMVAIQKGVSLVYQYWVHTEAIRRFPRWFESVFNTPSHHRVHHARNPRYLDANYAGILIIWDRMFGTYIPEDDAEPCRYGVVHNLGDFNIFRVAFHEWIAIGKDLAGSRSIREVFGYLFGPPGWSPDGSRDTSATLKAKWRAREAGAISPAAAAETAPLQAAE
jgi:sterol desaturase/sphingolipid hydroxylase (fatty acid hydroxylase superfamily)